MKIWGSLERDIGIIYSAFQRVKKGFRDGIQTYKNYIPLSSLILWYLDLTFWKRIVILMISSYFSFRFVYFIGFIILQSRAKNEVLSIASAFENPINFSDNLYYIYAFIFLFLTLTTVLLIGGTLFIAEKVFIFRIVGTRRKLVIFIYIFFVVLMLLILIIVIYHIVPFIPYYLIYSSKNSAVLESILKEIFLNKKVVNIPEQYSYYSFKVEMFLSTQLWILLMLLFIFLLRWSFKVRNKIGKGLAVVVVAMVSFFIFVSQIIFQFGYFGKTLSKFDTDYIEVEYEGKKIEGMRVFQSNNYIILRDKGDTMHYIESDKMYIKKQ